MISTDEAAKHIGKVSARNWSNWEIGKKPIPLLVIRKMRVLVARRFQLTTMPSTYYLTYIEYCEAHPKRKSVLEWRLMQSAAAFQILDSIEIEAVSGR